MTLTEQMNKIIETNNLLRKQEKESQEVISLEKLPEIKEIQLLQLQAQAETNEQLQDNMLILFGALAEISESLGGE